MMMLLRCVARAVMENGIEGLAKMVPGGEFVHKVAAGAWKKYREKKQKADDKKEIEALAQANFEQARQQAVVAVREAMEELAADRFPRPAPTKDDQERLELYLSQLPATAAQSLKRPEDPTGRTARPNFALDKSDDVERLLPARAPRFRLGAPLPGKPDWVLERPLGVGGFGEVWLARHKTLTALNGAVKFFHGQQARDLQHESALINRVMLAGEHDNIVKLTDVSLTGDVPWLMYEYVPGGDLTDLIREWQRLDPARRVAQALGALVQLTRAVAHFHKLFPAVVHRDLKPSNILVDRVSKRLRVTDFGIGSAAARAALNEERAGTFSATGRMHSYLRGSHTPLYSSPEQRTGAAPDPRDDVHAIGVIGYQLLTGELEHGPGFEFASEMAALGVSEEFTRVLGSCVGRRAESRPANARHLLELFQSLSAVAPTPSAIGPPAARPVPVPPVAPPAGSWVVTVPAAAYARPANNRDADWKRVAGPNETVGPEPGREYALVFRKTVTDQRMAPLAQLSGVPSLVRVELAQCKKLTEAGFRPLAALARLRELVLEDASVSDAALPALVGLTQLELLSLDHTAITDAGLAHVAGLVRLRTLLLRRTGIGPFGLKHIARLNSLMCLDVSGTGVKDVDLNNVPYERMTWFAANDTNLQDHGLFYVGRMRALEHLELDGTGVSEGGFAQLHGLSKLRSLRVGRTAATDAALTGLVRLPELCELDCAGCQRITGAVASGLARFPKLTRLVLDRTMVADSNVQALSGLGTLEELSLVGCSGITDASVGPLLTFTRLKSLSVSGTRITGQGLNLLRSVLSNVS